MDSATFCDTVDMRVNELTFCNIQGAAEITPRFGRGIALGGERVVEQWCTCRFQFTPRRGWENIEPLLLSL